jgi:hypothetical protein
MFDIHLLGFTVIIAELLALPKVLLDPIETINIHRLHAISNISCFQYQLFSALLWRVDFQAE